MRGPTPRRLREFLLRRLRLRSYLTEPGDGRLRPQIAPGVVLWAILVGFILRQRSFHSIETLVGLRARSMMVERGFCDDTLAYFVERLDAEPTRRALVSILKRAKRNKAFDDCWLIGLAVDGTGAGGTRRAPCALCRPRGEGKKGFQHALSMIAVVGTGITLPFDVEPYGPGDSEYAASQRLLTRAVERLGRRFADYVVADGEYATAPFLHLANRLGLNVVARLKENLPELMAAARARFEGTPPHQRCMIGNELVELWDAEDFAPWESLQWETVRVLRYRQHKPDGTVVEAYWLTDFSRRVGSLTLYKLAKTRWEIENEGFNDAKTRYGLEHIYHHHPQAMLTCWLLILLAMVIERLYRLRYLRRGSHMPYPAVTFVHLLLLSLGSSTPPPPDTS